MTKITGNFGKRSILISGGQSQIEEIEETIKKIEKIDKKHETISQLFDASKIAGKKHLLHSSKLALEAIENNRSFADSPNIELTCWTAGLRQINKSLERVGIKEDSEKIAIITIGKNYSKVEKAHNEIFQELGMEEDEGVLEITDDKINNLKEAFSVSQEQVEVSDLEKMILEKVALLSLKQ